jgi:hypothetical protein
MVLPGKQGGTYLGIVNKNKDGSFEVQSTAETIRLEQFGMLKDGHGEA